MIKTIRPKMVILVTGAFMGLVPLPVVRRTERDTAAATRKIKVKPSMQIYNNSIEVTYGIPIVPEKATSREKACPRVAEGVMGWGAETPEKRCENDSRIPMVKTCSIHTKESFDGWIGQGEHSNRRRMIMHATNSSIWRTNVCVSGGIYRRGDPRSPT